MSVAAGGGLVPGQLWSLSVTFDVSRSAKCLQDEGRSRKVVPVGNISPSECSSRYATSQVFHHLDP